MSSSAPISDLKPAVMVVDDEESMRDILTSILKNDYTVYTAPNLSKARALLGKIDIRLLLLDIRVGDENGLDLLKEVKRSHEEVEVVVITVIEEVKTAVTAMKMGAYDYITKDFDYDELRALLTRALDKQRSSRELTYLREEVIQKTPDDFYIGTYPTMLTAKEIADRVAALDTNILLTGETGTGKELMAHYIHRCSHLADKPFVTINLAAIPGELMESILFGHEKGAFTDAHRLHYGKFELANGGTLFLDEIGELRYDLQAKLLRALQMNEIERVGGSKMIPLRVRLITATNADLKKRIEEKKFREDLYYRLNVVPIRLPPLRDRIEAIPHLVELFLDRYNKKFNRHIQEFKPEIIEALSLYRWPGNVRELENFVERMVAVTQSESIGFMDIPLEFQLYKVESSEMKEGEDLLQKTLDAFEKSFLLRILRDEDWNRSQAAKRLGVHRKTLEYKIKRLNLSEQIDSERHREADSNPS